MFRRFPRFPRLSPFHRAFSVHNAAESSEKPMTIVEIYRKFHENRPISMLTAQDYSSGLVCDRARVDTVLVGDSLAMTTLGHENTLEISMDQMIHHAKAVRRGCKHAWLIGDMPFGTYFSEEDALRNAARFLQESSMNAVKLEGGRPMANTIKRLVSAGIPVVGHIGLTPQHVNVFGGFKVFGKEIREGTDLWEDAKKLRDSGASLLVLECVPEKLAALITENLGIPTIGIGSGNGCSGQVLVFNDLMGVYDRFSPKFCKKYARLLENMVLAARNYKDDVETRRFPQEKTHTFAIKQEVFEKVREIVENDPEKQRFPRKTAENAEKVKPKAGDFVAKDGKSCQTRVNSVVVLGFGAVGSLFAGKIQETPQFRDVQLRMFDVRGDFRGKTARILCNSPDLARKSETFVEMFDENELETEKFAGKIDVLAICVKNFSTNSDLSHFLSRLPQKTSIRTVLTLQNGYNNVEIIRETLKKHGFCCDVFPISLYSGVKVLKNAGNTGNSREICQSIEETVRFALPDALKDSEIQRFLENIKDFRLKHYIKSSFLDEKSFVDYEKLLINAVINPITAIFACLNGEILENPHLFALSASLCKECVRILGLVPNALDFLEGSRGNPKEISEKMAKLAKFEEIPMDFEEKAAFCKVCEVIDATKTNESSMLSDILGKREDCEVESLNGAMVSLAKARGLHENSYKINEMMRSLVKARVWKSG